jgi:hypothetical protein
LIWMRLFPYGVAAAVVLALLFFVYKAGEERGLNEVEKENRDAGNAATISREARNNCVASGGVFDFATGKCKRP